MNVYLNIAGICPRTLTLGPGNRFVVWLQGCPFNCKSCIAPEWISFEKAHLVIVEELAAAIIRADIDGITLSGGEPMMQAGRLAMLLGLVKLTRPELNTIVFSGFTLKQLVWDEAQELLSYCDLLIDGQYVDRKNDGIGLRGSSNQRFHFLTDRLLPFKEDIIQQRTELEIHLLDDGALLAGIPSAGFYW